MYAERLPLGLSTTACRTRVDFGRSSPRGRPIPDPLPRLLLDLSKVDQLADLGPPPTPDVRARRLGPCTAARPRIRTTVLRCPLATSVSGPHRTRPQRLSSGQGDTCPRASRGNWTPF